jgi:hypothetical protein
VPHGPEGGQWSWSVTATFAGPRSPFPHSGKEPTRKEAGRQVKEPISECFGSMAGSECFLEGKHNYPPLALIALLR